MEYFMEDLENFYYQIVASLKNLESKRLYTERRLPIEFPVYAKLKNTLKARRLVNKHKKLNFKIERGYYKAISDCLSKINKIYRDYIKCCSKD